MTINKVGVRSPLKRSLDDAFGPDHQTSKRARIDEEMRGVFAAHRQDNSISSLLISREIGLRPVSKDPKFYFEKGKFLFEKGQINEGQTYLDIAKWSCLPTSKDAAGVLVSVAQFEYWHECDTEALETLKILEQIRPSYRPFIALFKSLCSLDAPTSFDKFFDSFQKQWSQMIIRPSQCLLTNQEYQHHLKLMEHAVVVLSKKIDEENRPETESSFQLALYQLYLFQNKLEKARETAQIFNQLDLAFVNGLELLCYLKDENGLVEEGMLNFLDQAELNWEMENFITHSLCLKLLFNKALKNVDLAAISCALNHFLRVESSIEDLDQRLRLQSYLFVCYFALEQHENAAVTAQRMEALRPGSALLQRTLCRLAQGEKQNIIQDLQKCLEKKDPINGDPAFLTFVGFYLSRKSIELAEGFYAWSRCFYRF